MCILLLIEVSWIGMAEDYILSIPFSFSVSYHQLFVSLVNK